ncbi:MAG TPA: hypothetical protein PK504_13060 [Ferruginibacter sp.]|nr:hypothetical protein [Ferruginibacter sp.]HRE64900.1 hypothetical protein [Ferruginibacter sp.]
MNKIVSETSRSFHSFSINEELINSINNRFPLIAGYGIIKESGKSINYFVGISKTHSLAYRYETFGSVATELKEKDELSKMNRLDSMEIDKLTATILIQQLYDEKLWLLYYNDVDFEDLPCKHSDSIVRCNTSDGTVYRTLLAGKGKKIESKFYAPEFYETECCPGNSARKDFLDFKLVFDNNFPALLKKILPK